MCVCVVSPSATQSPTHKDETDARAFRCGSGRVYSALRSAPRVSVSTWYPREGTHQPCFIDPCHTHQRNDCTASTHNTVHATESSMSARVLRVLAQIGVCVHSIGRYSHAGADTPVWLATSAPVETVHGKFVQERQVKPW